MRDINQIPPVNPDYRPKLKQDVFDLAEGPCSIIYPAKFTEQGLEDFKAWVALVLRKVERSVERKQAAEPPAAAIVS